MSAWFSIEVRFPTGRYHGRDANTRPEWPPTPLRLFQALVAGALSGRWKADQISTEATLEWLESLGVPTLVLAPVATRLRPYRIAVPNNQADRHLAALGRGIRLDKLLATDKDLKCVSPWLVGKRPVIYSWQVGDDAGPRGMAAESVVRRLIALGTGLDHAVANVRLTDQQPTAEGLMPMPIGSSACCGTLRTLLTRHEADLRRLKSGSLRENRPPIKYNPPPSDSERTTQLVLAIRTPVAQNDRPLPIEPQLTAVVAQRIRLALAERLKNALRSYKEARPTSPEEIDRLVIGREATGADSARRLRISPLPSIGHIHADGLLRRILISIPRKFPLAPESVHRALVNCEFEVEVSRSHQLKFRLASVEESDEVESRMRERYLCRARTWRSVSPIVLPGHRAVKTNSHNRPSQQVDALMQAQIDSRRQADDEFLFKRAIAHAQLEHITDFSLRRESFDSCQPQAGAPWKLPKITGSENRVWLANRPRVHAEITFKDAQSGPIMIGDGRYLGLGLFRAVVDESSGRPELVRYRLGREGRPRVEHTVLIGDLLRRALMSGGSPPPELTGHDENGSSRNPAHRHAYFLPEDADGDGLIDHLIVYCRFGFSDKAQDRLRSLQRLWWIDRQSSTKRQVNLTLQKVGPPHAVGEITRLTGPGQVWRSITPYFRSRFRHKCDTDLTTLLQYEIQREWSLMFPGRVPPTVELEPGNQLTKFRNIRSQRDHLAPDKTGSVLQLTFSQPVSGPIALGRSSHYGLGLFATA